MSRTGGFSTAWICGSPQGSFTALVGESGCGKSTIAAILMGRNRGICRSVTIGGVDLREVNESSLLRNITYVSHQSYLFKGTVRDNLRMGKPSASDDELWAVLERVNLAGFLKAEQGLDTPLLEKGVQPFRRPMSAAGAGTGALTTARYTSLTRPPPTLMWKAKMTSWPKFIGWRNQNRASHFSPAGECSPGEQHLCAGRWNHRRTRQP